MIGAVILDNGSSFYQNVWIANFKTKILFVLTVRIQVLFIKRCFLRKRKKKQAEIILRKCFSAFLNSRHTTILGKNV